MLDLQCHTAAERAMGYLFQQGLFDHLYIDQQALLLERLAVAIRVSVMPYLEHCHEDG